MIYFDRGRFHAAPHTCMIHVIFSDDLTRFYKVLSKNNGTIVGSMALKMILPDIGNSWVPNDLYIAVTCSHLSSTSAFFQNIGYKLMNTSVDDCVNTSDVLSFFLNMVWLAAFAGSVLLVEFQASTLQICRMGIWSCLASALE